MAYANGRIPASALRDISTPKSLRADAAASFERLRAAAKLDGFNMGTSLPDHSYRSVERQEAILHAYYDHTWRPGLTYGNGGIKFYAGKTWYRKPGYATAATPGTSNHGWGVAVDFQGLGGYGGTGYAWMSKHAGEYGWDNVQGRSIGEAWHWVYNPDNDKHKGDKPVAPPTVKETDDMKSKSTATSTRQPVKAGVWKGLLVDGTSGYSILTEPHDTFSSVVSVGVEGLPVGSTLQVRFAIYDTKKKAYTTNFAIQEIHGSAGVSYGQVSLAHSFTGADQMLRVRFTGPDGATVVSSRADTLYSV